jgi:SAM-dependent methyltransferase
LFNINYRVADVETEVFPAEHYDAVWFNGSLHHIEALEKVCAKLARTIKADGYLFFNEYIGPSRFDFSERQKAVMQAAFELIPQRFRRCFIPGYPYEYKREISAPNPAQVSKVDPSEAVRSSEILEIVKEYFDIVVKNDTGGTILQFLLAGIAGNFRSDDPDSMSTLQMLFTIEDTLIKVGDIQSDFAVVVARPKS